MLPHSFSGMSPTEYSFPLAHRLPDFGDVIQTAVSDSISEAAERGRQRGIRPEPPGIRSIPGEIHARAIRTHTAHRNPAETAAFPTPRSRHHGGLASKP